MLQRSLSRGGDAPSGRHAQHHHHSPHHRPGKAVSSHRKQLSEQRRLRLWRMWRWFVCLLIFSFGMMMTLMYHTLQQVMELEQTSYSHLPTEIQQAIQDFGGGRKDGSMAFIPDEMFHTPPRRTRRRLFQDYDAVIPKETFKGYQLSEKAIRIPVMEYPNGTIRYRTVLSLEDPNQVWTKSYVHGRPHTVTGSKKDELMIKAEQQRRSIQDPLDIDWLYPLNNDEDDEVEEENKNTTTTTTKRHRWIDSYPTSGQLPFHSSTPYLGVMLDGGRHYFQVEWIKNLIDVLEQLNYNFIHFRLTDDQAFAILLESHPELAKPAPPSRTKIDLPSKNKNNNNNNNDYKLDTPKVYTRTELLDLIDYAFQRRIIIMPEINIPGHAGGWAGSIPNIIPPCANFCCEHGYGLPLNISHSNIYELLKNVIEEVYQLFHTSPYIHLGGDEVNMAQPCFDEVNTDGFNYNEFEEQLENLLGQLNINTSHVARWEMTGQKLQKRVDGIPHFWFSRHYENRNTHQYSNNRNTRGRRARGTMTTPTSSPTTTTSKQQEEQPRHLFVSTGLYFDTNQISTGWMIYENTKMLVNKTGQLPLGIIVGTFELGQDFWMDRNVIGRLLAVAMGASQQQQYVVPKEFGTHYIYYCRMMGWPMRICRAYGSPLVEEIAYKESWTNWTDRWKQDFCKRTTYQTNVREMIIQQSGGGGGIQQQQQGPQMLGGQQQWMRNNNNNKNPYQTTILAESTTTFWKHFGKRKEITSQQQQQHLVENSGIVLSLVQHGGTLDRNQVSDTNLEATFKEILDVLHVLGLNTMQLTLMEDAGMVFTLENHSGKMAWNSLSSSSAGDNNNNNRGGGRSHHQTSSRFTSWTMTSFRQLIQQHAISRNIQIIPEIAMATRGAGGWLSSGFHTACPHYVCKYGTGGAIDTTSNNMFLGIVSATIVELYHDVFKHSPYIHLGHDERKEAQECYYEANIHDAKLDRFETKMEKVLDMVQIPKTKVLRWENEEGVVYPVRAGDVTHYRKTVPTDAAARRKPHFISTGLNLEQTDDDNLKDAWGIYQQTRKYVQDVEEDQLPKGILATLGGATTAQYWDQLNIRGRLLAFAMALRKKNSEHNNNNYNSSEQFMEAYTKECESLWPGMDCNQGTITRPVMARKRLEQDQQDRIKASCDSKTFVQVYTFPKRGVLVPADDDNNTH